MPKSKRNKTVDLSKTKKHGLEGKKELYKKIQSNVENYAHVFVFAVNDMRNSKMKNVREQWKHSRFCIGKNKVMAMALGRTPEEEYRPNLHKIGQVLVGERGLLFTNQSVDEVANWFQSYSAGDYARSGNIATEDVVLQEGPLEQFPHNLESYLRQLGLPTTLKKGVIHLLKEHVVCSEGDRLSPETARILKLLGYEMAEFRIKMLSVWSQDGSFINLQSDSSDPEAKENAASPQKSFMREDFELAKDCLLLGDDDEMEVADDDSENENKISSHSEKEIESKNLTEDPEEEIEVLEVIKLQTPNGKKSFSEAGDGECLEIIPCDLEKQESEQVKSSSKKKGKKSFIAADENDSESIEIISCDREEKQESEQVKSSSEKNGKKSFIEAEENSGDGESLEIISCDIEKKQPEQVTSSSKKRGKKSFIEAEENSGDGDSLEIISCDLEDKQETEQEKKNSKKNKAKSANKEKQTDVDEMSENNTNSEGKVSDKSENDIKNSSPTTPLETEDVEMEMEEIQEPEVKKPKNDSTVKKSGRKSRATVRKAAKETEQTNDEIINNEKVSSKEEIVDSAAILKLTEKKLDESAKKPKKFSPKMTRARAAAANKKIKTPEPIETKRASRKRKV